MNVFVIGTGRCGTTTMYKALSHCSNYTVGHETKAGSISFSEYLEFPDNHIEVDAHLTWILPALTDKYYDDFFIHLVRRQGDVIKSCSQHPVIRQFVATMFQTPDPGPSLFGAFLDHMKWHTEECIEWMNNHTISIDNPEQDFREIWEYIGAEGDLDAALAEFKIKYNASPKEP